MIVRLASGAIKTEGHMSDGFAMLIQQRPNSFEMPAISYEAAPQALGGNCFNNFSEIRMQGWLAASEHYLFEIHGLARLSNDSRKKINGKKMCGTVIESVFVSQTITAMEVADIGQFDRQTTRAVVWSCSFL
jgi:hypothetical protein